MLLEVRKVTPALRKSGGLVLLSIDLLSVSLGVGVLRDVELSEVNCIVQ